MTREPYIAVVGPSAGTPAELALGEAIGRGIAESGGVLVCGGMGGVMEAAAGGCAEAGGRSVGILPGDSRLDANPYVTVAVATGMGEARNAIVVRSADVVIAVRGEYGTLSEIALALKMGKPVDRARHLGARAGRRARGGDRPSLGPRRRGLEGLPARRPPLGSAFRASDRVRKGPKGHGPLGRMADAPVPEMGHPEPTTASASEGVARMILGVTLLALGGLCTAAMVGVLLGATNDGTFVIAGSITLSHQSGAAFAVCLSVVAMGLLFLGLRRLEIWRAKRALEGRSDQRVPDIEQLARLRLLHMRYEQLKREVEGLEVRRSVALGEYPGAETLDETEDEVWLVPEVEGSTLSRRIRSETG